jgi:hypothetical protein
VSQPCLITKASNRDGKKARRRLNGCGCGQMAGISNAAMAKKLGWRRLR